MILTARQAGRLVAAAAALVVATIVGTPADAQVIAPEFAADYTLFDLGGPEGVPGPLGGLTLLAGDANTLLIGGDANNGDGAIYSIGLIRDMDGHITGFDGPATLYSTAPFIDGGLAYGPDGVLLYTAFPTNELGQIKPGSSTPDKVLNLTDLGINASVGTLGFVPPGFPGAGDLHIASYSTSDYYSATLTPDGMGTFDLTDVVLETTVTGGPEGLLWVPAGSPVFTGPSMLICEWGVGMVSAYDLDANGIPDLSTRRDFITGLSGAEGAFLDPLTGDFLFSTFGGGDRVLVVRGFAPAIPEPGSLALVGLGLLGGGVAYRLRRLG